MFLASTSDKLQVVTGSAANVTCSVAFADNNAGAVTPDRKNTAAIITATTTDITGSPGSGVQRRIRDVEITNNHATASTRCRVQHTDGTNANDVSPNVLLLPGESLDMADDGRWVHLDRNGAPYDPVVPTLRPTLSASAYLAEAYPREQCNENSTGAVGATTVCCAGLWLPAGLTVTNIIWFTGSQGIGGPTHWWFGLYNSDMTLIGQSADQTTGAWAATTLMSLALATPVVIGKAGLHYAAFGMTGTTNPKFKCFARTDIQLSSIILPILGGTSSSELASAAGLPGKLSSLTTGYQERPWAAVS